MKYGTRHIEYTLQSDLVDAVDVDDYAETNQPKHARKRSVKALRRSSSKKRSGAHPGCGIGGRRNRQYSW